GLGSGRFSCYPDEAGLGPLDADAPLGRTTGQALDIDDHRDAGLLGLVLLLDVLDTVPDLLHDLRSLVDAGDALDHEGGAGGVVAVKQADVRVLGDGPDDATVLVTNPDGNFRGAVSLDAATHRKV